MGQAASSLEASRVRKQVELNNTTAVLKAVEHSPALFGPVFGSGSTLLHVVARHGSTSMLAAVAALHEQLKQPMLQHARHACDEGHHRAQLHWKPQAPAQLVGQVAAQCRQRAAGWATSEQEHRRQHAALPDMQQLINVCNARKETPLLIAASRGHSDLVNMLLQMGADPHVAERKCACTALHLACMHGHTEVVRLILTALTARAQQRAAAGMLVARAAAGPSSGISSRGTSPSRMGSSRVAEGSSAHAGARQLAGDGGMRPSSSSSTAAAVGQQHNRIAAPSPSSDAETAGARQGLRDTVGPCHRLLAMRTHAGATALHYAADAGHVVVVRLLCAHGADIHTPMQPTRFQCVTLHSGATPLHLAAEQGHLPVALALLKHYQEHEARSSAALADNDPRDAQDRSGLRPHQLAFLTQHFRMALVIRPNYPLSWLFESTTMAGRRPTIPRLSSLASAALHQHLRGQLDRMEALLSETAGHGHGWHRLQCVPAQLEVRGGPREAGDASTGTPGESRETQLRKASCEQDSVGSANQRPCQPCTAPHAGSAACALPSADHASSNSSSSSCCCSAAVRGVCDVCFEEGAALVQLQPCSHTLCVGCARQLCDALTSRPMTCPFCRANVSTFTLPCA